MAPNKGGFGITLDKLEELVNFDRRESDELTAELEAYGGVEKVAKDLKSDVTNGRDPNDDAEARKEYFGINKIPEPPPTPLWVMVVDQFQDRMLQVLMVGAFVNIVIGSIIDPEVGWIEGVAIFVAVTIVVTVTVGNDYSKEKSFRKAAREGNDEQVRVIRGGKSQQVSIYDLLVGDVVSLGPGANIPADGIFIRGNDLTILEAALTGESLPIKKGADHPFVFSGTKVSGGTGDILLTAVGALSQGGKIQLMIMFQNEDSDEDERNADDIVKFALGTVDEGPPENCLCYDDACTGPGCEQGGCCYNLCGGGCCFSCCEGGCCIVKRPKPVKTPLQEKLGTVADLIGYIGGAAGLATFIAMTIRVIVDNSGKNSLHQEALEITERIVHALVIGVTIVVVAVPEGLPLAVTIALAFGMLKMMTEKNFVKTLAASETMGSATCICSDKTGTLTQNKMTVTKSLICAGVDVTRKGEAKNLPDKSYNFFVEGAAANSTAEFIDNPDGGERIEDGSPTEIAILRLLEDMGVDYLAKRTEYPILKSFPFSSKKKRMATIVDRKGKIILYSKGAAEIILSRCSQFVTPDGKVKKLDGGTRAHYEDSITNYAHLGLRTISLAYKVLDGSESSFSEGDDDDDNAIDTDMVYLGVVGIKDPLRPEVIVAVQKCKRAGLVVRMVTGDKVETANSIARECGILGTNDGTTSMEGPEFRTLTKEERLEIVPNLRVLARSAPEDKIILVETLQKLGEIVAVTGDGTNDGPALRKADVGFAMGIAGTGIAKDACDIVLLDDNFASIVSAMRWGRNIYDSIRKFLQFQLSVNCVAIIVTFVGAVAIGDSPMSAVQLLWVNLIMDTLGALALATESPSNDLLLRSPNHPQEPVMTRRMWLYISVQTVYQTTILLLVLFGSHTIFNVRPFDFGVEEFYNVEDSDNLRILTYVFCVFVLLQLVNIFQARHLDHNLNLFKRIFNNVQFPVIWFSILIVQVVIVSVIQSPQVAGTTPISFEEWTICFALSIGVVIVDYVVRVFSKMEPFASYLDARFEPSVAKEEA